MKPIKDLYNWALSNKLTAILVIVVAYFLFKNFIGPRFELYRYGHDSMGYGYGVSSKMMEPSISSRSFMETDMMGTDMMMEESYTPGTMPMVAYDDGAANVAIQERKVITNTWISLLVKDVRDTADKIAQEADNKGGFTVTKNVYTPMEGGNGDIEVRIPLSERDAMMEFLHNLGIRVLNESTNANDITDQYEDLDAKLATLTKTKDRFEEIYDQAETIEEILKVQSQLLNLQRQIDDLTGRIKELEGKADTTLISVSLTTDELALGYTPGDPWAPQNTLKLATRSLNMTFRDIGNFAIWAGVYALIWLPLLGAGIVVVKMLNNKSKDKSKK